MAPRTWRSARPQPAPQPLLPYGPIRNSGLFSNHWLEHRLRLEPEWQELRGPAEAILDRLVELWDVQRSRVERYGDEPGLEHAFIQPVLEALGWKLKYQTFLRGRRPDYALFLDEPALGAAIAAGRDVPEFWNFPQLVGDAKAWHVNLDQPVRTAAGQREYPPEQIEWYLDRSRLDFAILTNGRQWRLIPRTLGADQRRFQTYFECELPPILDTWKTPPSIAAQQHALDDFLTFYLFLGPAGFQTIAEREPLIRRAIAGSSEYRLGVGEGLKERVFEALRLCIEGLLSHPENRLDPQADLAACREESFTLLYRLLFIMYAEDRRLLPYRANRAYTENRSLGRQRDYVAGELNRVSDGQQHREFSRDQTALWADLLNLFDLIDRGHRTYGVPAYNGGLFDPDAHPFLAQKAIPDWHLARIIDQLGRAPDPERPQLGLFRVDYRDLAIQHLGAIYEGLLELHPRRASAPMIVVRRGRGGREERIVPAADRIPEGFEATVQSYDVGAVYLVNDKGERRASGSYYTPNHIVDYIVSRTLGPLCAQIDQSLKADIVQTEAEYKRSRNSRREAMGQKLERLRGEFDDRVLRLRVLDPAMGSGHFLLRACQYLAEEIATNPNTDDPNHGEAGDDQSTLIFWKRRVVERCLYGVDFNPMAVELAKLALWLETVSASQPLSFLDHHLLPGNSLVGAEIASLGMLPGEPALPSNAFRNHVEGRLPVLLRPLQEIRSMASETVQQVKAKEALYRRAFEPVRRPLLKLADLWCSTFFTPAEVHPTAQQYLDAIEALKTPANFEKMSAEPWFDAGLRAARCKDVLAFHWELEFPEAFFNDTGPQPEGGFDAIIGNPPYDVLSDKENRRDLSALRAFLESQPVYGPSFRGKNNLYKLFVCRAIDLLRQGGRLGFITPMAILGDDQAAELRKLILGKGAFTSVDAFPQKDDPERRVFREAKLSTVAFTLVKADAPAVKSLPFVSRTHPAQFVREDSPTLALSTADIPLYDPANATIVSCGQADWDVAARIMRSGRMARLKDYAEFFQGEVNETNERAKGNLIADGTNGRLVTRGASICLYVVRPASQGADLHLDVTRFLEGKGPRTKAYHHRYRRVGWQESCPQNNFRRVIAAIVPAGEFFNHTVNYCPDIACKLPL